MADGVFAKLTFRPRVYFFEIFISAFPVLAARPRERRGGTSSGGGRSWWARVPLASGGKGRAVSPEPAPARFAQRAEHRVGAAFLSAACL